MQTRKQLQLQLQLTRRAVKSAQRLSVCVLLQYLAHRGVPLLRNLLGGGVGHLQGSRRMGGRLRCV